MKGDFSRDTFDTLKHFSRVLMQQGRAQLDADWNEQAAILLHYLQTLAADLIGPHGGPASSFMIGKDPIVATPDFIIRAGHYYVDGILIELEGTAIPITAPNQTGQVYVPTLIVDNLEFKKGQYVEVFDAAQPPASPPVLSVIAAVEPMQRQLTLSPNPSKFENALAPRLRHITTGLTQPNHVIPTLQSNQKYLVYLDVWERHITSLEDESIREVALGGPDTCTRAQVVWQVKIWPPNVTDGTKETKDLTCQTVKDNWSSLVNVFQPENRGRLKAEVKSPDVDLSQPCITPPEARYRGVENQLYRVEVHRGGRAWNGKTLPDGQPAGNKDSAATFKWSRDNGSAVFPILSLGDKVATLAHLGRDSRLTLEPEDWVEIVDDNQALKRQAGTLAQVASVDQDRMTVTFKDGTDLGYSEDSAIHPLLRRWDHQAGDPTEGGLGLSEGAALIREDDKDWLTLEDGLQIQFRNLAEGQPANQYRTGDYWLIPARTATSDVDWPRVIVSQPGQLLVTEAVALPPRGEVHHYAPLAIVSLTSTGEMSIDDCRPPNWPAH
jgi:hypothetical protein